MGMFLLSACVQ